MPHADRGIQRQLPSPPPAAASSTRDAVRDTLDTIKPSLATWVSREIARARRGRRPRGSDIQALLGAILENWETVFDGRVPKTVRHYVFELKDVRNRWAHEESFSDDEARRAADTARLIARAIGAPEDIVSRLSCIAESIAPVLLERRVREKRRLSDREDPSNHRPGIPPVRQRDVMRRLFVRFAPDTRRVISEYAAAERRGEVLRYRNTRNQSPEEYARRLLADGVKKGWLGATG